MLTIIWNDGNQGETRRRTQDCSLEAREEKTKVVWSYEAPPTFTVRVQSADRKWERTFRNSDYPASLLRKSAAGPTTRMIVRNGQITFADCPATPW